MNSGAQQQYLTLFLEKFYDTCAGVESSNITLDEFWNEFPEEYHTFIQTYLKIMKDPSKYTGDNLYGPR